MLTVISPMARMTSDWRLASSTRQAALTTELWRRCALALVDVSGELLEHVEERPGGGECGPLEQEGTDGRRTMGTD